MFLLGAIARNRDLLATRAFSVLTGLLLLIWTQFALGYIPYLGDALLSSLYLTGFAFAYALGKHSFEPDKRSEAINWLAVLFTTGATISVFIALLQWLRMENALGVFAAERGPQMRPFANLGQPNHLATLLLMSTVMAFGLYTRAVLKRWHLAVLVAWFCVGLTMTESRSALLSVLVLGLLFGVSGSHVQENGRWRVVTIWWAMLIVLATVWAPLNEALYLQAPREASLANDSARMVMWKQSLVALGDSPWIGYGWRQTMVALKSAAESVPGWLATDYAHNLLLDILLWVGIPLGCLLIGAALWWLIRCSRQCREPLPWLLFAAVVPLLVHSMFEFPFAYAYFLFPAAWMLGGLSHLQGATMPLSASPHTRLWALAPFAIFAILLAGVWSEYLAAEEDHRIMRFELRQVGRTPPGYEPPNLQLLTQFDEMLKLGRLTPTENMAPRDIERLRIATASFGWATMHLKYVVALGLNGQPVEATHQAALIRSVYGEQTYADMARIFKGLQLHHPALFAVKVP
jgi:O-antigen ligase